MTGGEAEEPDGLLGVLVHTFSFIVAHSEIELSTGLVLRCGVHVAGNTIPNLVAPPELALGECVTLVGSAAKTADGLLRILSYTDATIVARAKSVGALSSRRGTGVGHKGLPLGGFRLRIEGSHILDGATLAQDALDEIRNLDGTHRKI